MYMYIIYKYISDTSLLLISFRNFYLDRVFMHRVCMCVYTHVYHGIHAEDNVWDLSLSIHFYVGSGAQAYGIGLEQQAVYLLCHLMDPMYLCLIKALVKEVIYLCLPQFTLKDEEAETSVRQG